MRLEDQVCSLELAKRLKELGVKQTAFWSWYDATDRDDTPTLNRSTLLGNCTTCRFPKAAWDEEFSAFTVAELGKMLPRYTKCWQWHDLDKQEDGRPYWNCENEQYNAQENAINESDARAKMLIYLLENNLTAAK